MKRENLRGCLSSKAHIWSLPPSPYEAVQTAPRTVGQTMGGFFRMENGEKKATARGWRGVEMEVIAL